MANSSSIQNHLKVLLMILLIFFFVNMYNRQFPMRDDWEQIHVGLFYSFTTSVDSVTGNNEWDRSMYPDQ